MTIIDWGRLERAVEWYKREVGARYVDVPWWVSREILNITTPSGASSYQVVNNGKYLVASGEQSFLYLLSKGQLTPETLYTTVTPCFREEAYSTTHRKHFMKCELFAYGLKDSMGTLAHRVMNSAQRFFEHESIACAPVGTDHHESVRGSCWDLLSTPGDIELGSYGLRENSKLGCTWLYATGCAEPRMSVAKAAAGTDKSPVNATARDIGYANAGMSVPDDFIPAGPDKVIDVTRGYHLRDIPQGEYGELSKVREELEEAQDACDQDAHLMYLQELSDIVGAAGACAEFYNLDLDDLVKMAKITSRAFKNGHRRAK